MILIYNVCVLWTLECQVMSFKSHIAVVTKHNV